MTAKELLQKLEQDRVTISVKDGQLALTGEKSKITPSVVAEIQSNKAALISLLSNFSPQPNTTSARTRCYRREDGSYFELYAEEFDALVEFFVLINSLNATQ